MAEDAKISEGPVSVVSPVVAPERQSVEELLRRGEMLQISAGPPWLDMTLAAELVISFGDYRSEGFSVEESCWKACAEWGV